MSYVNQPALFYEHPFTAVYPTQIHMTSGKNWCNNNESTNQLTLHISTTTKTPSNLPSN